MKNTFRFLGIILMAAVIVLAFTACPIGPEPVPPEPVPPEPVHVHQWGAWSVTTAATCTTVGLETRTCALNSAHKETRDIAIDPNAHNWQLTPSATAPTCTVDGYGDQICAFNAEHTKNGTIPKLGHDWEWVVTTPATTTADGLETETCKICGATNGTRPIAKLSNKTNPTVTWPQGLTAVQGQTLSVISLASYTNSGGTAGAFSWTTPSDLVGNSGARSHNMTFTPTDTANYNTVTNNVSVFVSLPGSLVEMVHVAGGTFTMGSPTAESGRDSDESQHQVTLSAFYIGKYEVTQEQYQTVMGTNPSNFTSNPASGEVQNRRPVENVTWYDAVEFCNKLSTLEGLTPVYTITNRTPASGYPITSATVTMTLGNNGYRLPTEAQWEYACRAGTTTAYNTGDTISDDTGWYYDNSGSKTHEVGKKPANAWGLYDMHGNVYEWCWDWYGTYTTPAGPDPVGASSGSDRVVRGGGWGDTAQYARSACRSDYIPSGRGGALGFRLLRPAQ